MQREIVYQYNDLKHFNLIVSCGFDDTTGQSMYKLQWKTEISRFTDESLFVSRKNPIWMKI